MHKRGQIKWILWTISLLMGVIQCTIYDHVLSYHFYELLVLVYVESVSLFFCVFFLVAQYKWNTKMHTSSVEMAKNDDDDDFPCNHFILTKQGSWLRWCINLSYKGKLNEY